MLGNETPIIALGSGAWSEEELRAYFAGLEKNHPQIIEAMKVMNISYRQYLAAVQALSQQSSFSTNSTQLLSL